MSKKLSKKSLDITVILDRSGSMFNCVDDTIGGFNKFLEDQKKVKGKASITLVQFNHNCETVYENIDIKKAKPLTHETFKPEGNTALYDAIGKAVSGINKRLEGKNKDVLVIILTDGAENSSKEYNYDGVKALIELHQNEKKFTFVFLAANMDAIKTASYIGINTSNAINYSTNNMQGTMQLLSRSTSKYRSGGPGGQCVNYFGGQQSV